MLSEAAIERNERNRSVFIFLPHPSITEALWQGHTKAIKLNFVLFCHKVFEKMGQYVYTEIYEMFVCKHTGTKE